MYWGFKEEKDIIVSKNVCKKVLFLFEFFFVSFKIIGFFY